MALEIPQEFQITGLTEEEKDEWNRVWHRLNPWPDSIAGLTRLKKNTIAPLSTETSQLLTDMAKFARLPWDAILSAELARHYKPDREVYLTAAALLGLKPEDVSNGRRHILRFECGAQLWSANAALSTGRMNSGRAQSRYSQAGRLRRCRQGHRRPRCAARGLSRVLAVMKSA